MRRFSGDSAVSVQLDCRFGLVETPVVGIEVFVFTDIVGSTRRWAADPAGMRCSLEVHDRVLGDALRDAGGRVFKHTGDGVLARFMSAPAAVAGAVAAQRLLSTERHWGGAEPLAVRMAIHAGDAEPRGDDWSGPALNRCARLLAIGHGGQILLSDAARALCVDGLPAGVGTIDMGAHRLRDLLSAEHVWQVDAPGLPVVFPPLRSLDGGVGNLPSQLTRFVGREIELGELAAAVSRDRLTTVVGPGGMGKTRLALQVAGEVADKYPDGVWWVELAPLRTGDAIDHAAAAALQVQPGPGSIPRQALIGTLRERHMLLVIDNCEHLRAAAAEFVDDLLAHCPQLAIVATSREPLHIPGEMLWPIAPLDPQGSALELFVERCTAVRRDFALQTEDHTIAVDICRRLDGMPLAIELAASRMRFMTVQELAAGLDQRFRLLGGIPDEGQPRHATLQAVVAWSFGLLEPVEQRLLCRLAVFAGSFDREAAHQVCVVGRSDPDLVENVELVTASVLDRLVDRSLLLAEPVDGHTRFRLLETIRQWAAERVPELLPVLAASHAAYYAGLLNHVRLRDGARLVVEIDNIRLAVQHALTRQDTAMVLGMIRQLRRHVTSSMRLLEAEQWTEDALALPDAENHADALWAHCLLAAAGSHRAEPARTVREAQAALAIEQRLGLEPHGIARWWLCAGEIGLGNYEAADRWGREAISVTRAEQVSMRLEILFQLVHSAVYQGGEPDPALLGEWRRAASQARSPSDHFTVNYLEGVIAARSDPQRAAECYEQAVRWSESAALEHSLASGAQAYAGLMRAGDDAEAALISLERGLVTYQGLRTAFGLRRLVRDFLPPFSRKGDHLAVATIDGAAAPPATRPAAVAEAIAQSRAALGTEQYEQAFDAGRAMSENQLEDFVLNRLPAGSDSRGRDRKAR